MKKYQSLTGMNDLLPEQARHWHKLENTARELFHLYGYGEVRTPLLEDTSLFARGIGSESQVVQKEMYTFDDKGGDSVTLRPEGTAGVVRSYIQNSLYAQDAITKLYYMGPMFRYERPQKGRLRQFHQIGLEILGTDSPQADSEVIVVLDRLIQKLGIKNYTLDLNSIGTAEERAQYVEKLKAYFEAHKNDLSEESQNRLNTNPLRIFDSKLREDQKICKDAPLILDHLGEESQAHFAAVQADLKAAGVKFNINPKIVRGLDYYEKTAFEFTSPDLGSQSAIAGGGRYNKLVEELGGPNTPAIGFGLGCERVVLLLEQLAAEEVVQNGVYFVFFDEASHQKAKELTQMCRDAGVRSELGYEVKSFKSQMRRANKFGFSHVALLGEDEMSKQSVALKDMLSGDQSLVSWDELLNKVS